MEQASTPPQRTLKDYLKLVVSGFLIGSSDIVPGVSGGTMAFILGIYDELLNSIRSVVPFARQLLKLQIREAFETFPWKFLLSLGIGLALAVLSLAQFLDWALEEHPALIYSVFFGLILASIFVVRGRVKQWSWVKIAVMAGAAIFAFVLVGLTPAQTPEALWFIFLSGALAICAMILPGISGAFILVLLGKYQYILSALLAIDILTIAVFMSGAAVGIIAFSNVLHWLLDHYHDLTVATLIGFMIGALRKLWPWKEIGADGHNLETNILPEAFNGEVLAAIGLMVLGYVVVMGIEWGARRGKGRE